MSDGVEAGLDGFPTRAELLNENWKLKEENAKKDDELQKLKYRRAIEVTAEIPEDEWKKHGIRVTDARRPADTGVPAPDKVPSSGAKAEAASTPA